MYNVQFKHTPSFHTLDKCDNLLVYSTWDWLPWERIFMWLWLYKSVCILYLRDASINRILLIEVSWTDIMDLIAYYIHVAGIDATCRYKCFCKDNIYERKKLFNKN